jgi:redox-sensitive bicupin YhaK (pirin superfamily)
MIQVRPANERGHADHGWLDTRFSFSFADYFDPDHMGFRSLRVINDDRVAAGAGFPMHPHRDMEIITYMLDGEIAHKDSMGNTTTIKEGEVQRMTAGSGIYHSEFNPSQTTPTRLLQIWIHPRTRGLKLSYDQRLYDRTQKSCAFKLVASPTGVDGSMKIEQDVSLYASVLNPGDSVTYTVPPARHAWVQVARGSVTVNGTELVEGDGAQISDESELHFTGKTESEFLLFDLA